MTIDRRKTAKRRKLEDCYQKLYQAQASNDKIQIKIWKDIIGKLESLDKTEKN
jgi:hypothetical protein